MKSVTYVTVAIRFDGDVSEDEMREAVENADYDMGIDDTETEIIEAKYYGARELGYD